MRQRVRTPIDYLIYALSLALIVLGGAGIYDALFVPAQRKTEAATTRRSGGLVGELLQPEPFPGRRRVTVLLAGVDERKGDKGRADTLLVAFLNPRLKRAALLAIPRDLKVSLPSKHFAPKINHAYACEGGMQVVKDVVQKLISEPIDYYAKANFQGFVKIVDELGGVWIDVDDPLYYDDNWGNLHIALEPGHQHLDGYEAMGYVRFRQSHRKGARYHRAEGTDKRLQRQQRFLQAMAEQKVRLGNAVRLAKVVPELMSWIETDMNVDVALQLMQLAREIDKDSIIAETIPHEGKKIGDVWYDVLLEDEFRDLERDMLARLDSPTGRPCAVEVLNGAGQNGLAAAAAGVLQAKGFTAVRVDNADSMDHRRTLIYYQSGHINDADLAAKALGCGHLRPEEDPLKHYAEDAPLRVIVGGDFEPPEDKAEPADRSD